MPVVRVCCMLLLALLVAGCASQPRGPAIEPNLSLLAPAKQALKQARSAHAEKFAPRALDAARRRLALARDVVYLAARQGRKLNEEESERVKDLVNAARLDARMALTKTQAIATGVKLQEMQHTLAKKRAPAGGGTQ